MPFHLPTPFTFVNLPVPLAWRGPATPLILVWPEPEMSPVQGNLVRHEFVHSSRKYGRR